MIHVVVYGSYRRGMSNGQTLQEYGKYHGIAKLSGFFMYKLRHENFPRVERAMNSEYCIIAEKWEVPDKIFYRMHGLEVEFGYYLDAIMLDGKVYFIWLSYPMRNCGEYVLIPNGDWKKYYGGDIDEGMEN